MADNAKVWAAWRDFHGSVYVWGQGTVDNRLSRVIGRINGIDLPCDVSTLRLFDSLESADNYASEIRGE
jgi:hypothetical protein